jgi:hypothetical protein
LPFKFDAMPDDGLREKVRKPDVPTLQVEVDEIA